MGFFAGLISMLGWGIFYTFLTILVDAWGWFFAAFLVRVFLLLFLIFYLLFFKQPFSFKPKSNLVLLILGIGIFEVIATLSYNIGIERELTAIVAPISATFPLITIILAGIFLKERLILNQYFGIVSVIFGLVLLAL